MKRRRLKQETSLEKRLAMAEDCRERAEQLLPGKEREALLKRARQADTAVHISEWISSPGLRPPK